MKEWVPYRRGGVVSVKEVATETIFVATGPLFF
jgi:hypothetical protein